MISVEERKEIRNETVWIRRRHSLSARLWGNLRLHSPCPSRTGVDGANYCAESARHNSGLFLHHASEARMTKGGVLLWSLNGDHNYTKTLKKLHSGVQHSLWECKGVWWMPWLRRAMKDVEWRRYVSARCQSTFDPEMSEWGNPPGSARNSCMRERTQGSETSQYL